MTKYIIARVALGVVVAIVGLFVGAQMLPDGKPVDDGSVAFCLIIALFFEAAYVAYVLW